MSAAGLIERKIELQTARVFAPLLNRELRYKGGRGGRASGKSQFFAGHLVEECMLVRGTRAIGLREFQKSTEHSNKRLVEQKLNEMGVASHCGFKVFDKVIETPGDGLIVFEGLQDHTAESIKSMEDFRIVWAEESQTLGEQSLAILRPTLRKDGSQLWFSWNPRRATDAIEKLLGGTDLPTGACVVTANWRDNPWFPAVMEQERQDCLRLTPEQYGHIWDGEYATVLAGAYYAESINRARLENRIGRVAADPLLTLRVFVDIGGTGAKADAFAMWVAQFVGKEVRVLDYYEAQGQPLDAHVGWLRSKGYTPARAQVWLPHDGKTNDRVHDVSFLSAFRQAGYSTTVIENQGKGAARGRIEAARRLFPSMWFNEETTAGGVAALGWYHEKRDEVRNIGLGPDHDWSSHGSDAFGLLAVAYEEPAAPANMIQRRAMALPACEGSWMN